MCLPSDSSCNSYCLPWVSLTLDLGYLFRTAPKKRSHCSLPWRRGISSQLPLLTIGDWNAKVGSQETPGVTGKFGLGMQNETEQRLIEFCQENALVRANTLFQQHKRRLYTWTSPAGQHQNQIDYILCRQRWRSSTQSAKTRPGDDCGSDHELLIAKLKKVRTLTPSLLLQPPIKFLLIL